MPIEGGEKYELGHVLILSHAANFGTPLSSGNGKVTEASRVCAP
jgi:hypothetical protein